MRFFINVATRFNKKSEIKNPQKGKSSSINTTKEKRTRHDANSNEVMTEVVSNTNLHDENEIWVVDLERPFTNSINKENESIELEERKMALLERQVKLRKEMAEAEAIELKNKQLKMSLGLTL